MSTAGSQNAARAAPFGLRTEYIPVLIFLGGLAVVLTLFSPRVWLVLLTDGLLAAVVPLAAAGWGAWPMAWLGGGRRRPLQRVCMAVALGLGLLGVSTLALGVAGILNRVVAWVLIAGGGVAGVVFLYVRQAGGDGEKGSRGRGFLGPLAPFLRGLVLLPLVVPAAVALFGAALPPGLIWEGEANGYDVLEYHLQAPREYFDAGRIGFLPHNVYASFPQQMEMLYLLLMHLAGGPYAAVIACQILHALCGGLAVLALVAWTFSPSPSERERMERWPAVLVALVAGSVPWLAYLGCLAYVELGLLFFAAVAGGLLLESLRKTGDWRTVFAAGLCAGFAGGCKYTALALVAAALGIAWFCFRAGPLRRRLARLMIFGAGVLLAFSPWLIRNFAFTGNPVYPFAYHWFGGAAWSAEQTEQWERGHRLPEADASIAGRARIVYRELFASGMFGPLLFILAAGGLFLQGILRRSRAAWMLLLWAGLMVLIWAMTTHMPGRFVVPVVVPLVLLVGVGISGGRHCSQSSGTQEDSQTADHHPVAGNRIAERSFNHSVSRWLGLGGIALAFVGAIFNATVLIQMLHTHDQRWTKRTGVAFADMVGQVGLLYDSDEINNRTPPNAYVWLVGDAAVFYRDRKIHYTVPFNRDPWLEFARAGASPEACVDWLRTRNVTHVVFSWAEIGRLRRTYGFAEIVTPDWVRQLAAAGLRRVETDENAAGPVRREIFEVSPK